MDSDLSMQLTELAVACNAREISPIICGGLGIYLSFCKKENEVAQMIRATQDIDLMLSSRDLVEEVKRIAIAKIITEDLEYIVRDSMRYHGFVKEPNRQLDVLAPPVEGLKIDNYRVEIVESVLHGRKTDEAVFIDEDLRSVRLSEVLPGADKSEAATVFVPSPTNMMIMKLCAFADRSGGARQTDDKAQAHAWDIYVAIMLTDRNDLKEGQDFLRRHSESSIILGTQEIVRHSFSEPDQKGWQAVLQSSNFYPNLNRKEKEEKLEQAGSRLMRWFKIGEV
jgi:hypothetical protein